MGQSSGIAGYNTFVGGLVTDSSSINASDNTIKVGDNFEITKRGTLEKRLGLERDEVLLDSLSEIDTETQVNVINATTYDGIKWLVIYQDSGTKRALYTINTSNNSVELLDTSVDSVSVNDKFIIATKGKRVKIFKYDQDASSFSSFTQSSIKVRDFSGINEDVDNDFRPLTLTAEHLYNLENQGWGKTLISRRTNVNALDLYEYYLATGRYPSNADIASLGIVNDANDKGRKEFLATLIKDTYLGNARAPMGSKILDTLESEPRSLTTTTVGSVSFSIFDLLVTVPTNTQTFTLGSQPINPFAFSKLCSTFFAGRVFYGGGNNVFFSQVLLEDERKATLCYQEADPTSEEDSELVATDGGQIVISGAANIFKLEEVGGMLVVFAENGIWVVTGGDATFSATQYVVKKVSTYTAASSSSVVNFAKGLIFLSESGMLSLGQSEVTLDGIVSSISDGKIAELYYTYTSEQLKNASVVHSQKDNKVYFLFGRQLLVLDLLLGAFYTLRVPAGCVGLRYVDGAGIASSLKEITYGGTLLNYDGEQLILSSTVPTSVIPQVHLLYPIDGELVSCSFSNLNYVDFEGEDNESEYDAYFITHPIHGGSLSTKKRIKQLACFFERTETGYTENDQGGLEYVNPSSCTFQVGWDFPTNTSYINDNYSKWSREYEVYRLSRYEANNLGESPQQATETISTRTSIRGMGRTMSLKFSSPAGYDCRLLGWTVEALSTTREK
jgi:hypothetical protein